MDPQSVNTGDLNNSPLPQNSFQPQQSLQPMQPMAPAPTSNKKSSKKKFVLIGAFLAIFLFGGSAAAYVQFVANSPENIWERAMNSTAKGLDAMAELQKQQMSSTSAQKLDGTFKLTSPLAADGSISLVADKSNAEMTMDVGAAGTRLNAEMRMVDAANSDSPDIYFKVKGLDSIGALLGLGGPEAAAYGDMLTAAEDQWYSVDHTLFDQALASAAEGGGSLATLSQEDLNKIALQFSTVVKDTLLSTDPQKAVFEVANEVGKEDFEGTKTFKYEVRINKDHLKSFITEMKSAMADTKVAELVASMSGQSYEEAVKLDELFADIDKQDFSNSTADVWVEAGGRYIRNVRLYPVKDDKQKNYLDIGIPYNGGDTIPLSFKAVIDDEGTRGTVASGIELNRTSNGLHGWGTIDVSMDSESDPIKFEYDMNVNPTNDAPKTDKPEGVKDALELLGALNTGAMTRIEDSTSLDQYDSLLDQSLTDDIELQ